MEPPQGLTVAGANRIIPHTTEGGPNPTPEGRLSPWDRQALTWREFVRRRQGMSAKPPPAVFSYSVFFSEFSFAARTWAMPEKNDAILSGLHVESSCISTRMLM